MERLFIQMVREQIFAMTTWIRHIANLLPQYVWLFLMRVCSVNSQRPSRAIPPKIFNFNGIFCESLPVLFSTLINWIKHAVPTNRIELQYYKAPGIAFIPSKKETRKQCPKLGDIHMHSTSTITAVAFGAFLISVRASHAGCVSFLWEAVNIYSLALRNF